MYGLSRLHLLQEINLSNNAVVTIEGLKELVHLRHLNLQGNTIKSIEHLNTNVQLEYLNLAENSIGSISDISVLKNLKVQFFTMTREKFYFFIRDTENSLIFQVLVTMTMNFAECYTHRLSKLNALMQSFTHTHTWVRNCSALGMDMDMK